MRLGAIYILCRDNIDAIEGIVSVELTGVTAGYCRISGWKKASTAISKELLKAECLRENIQNLVNCIPEIYQTVDSFKLSGTDTNKILGAKRALLEQMKVIISIYESMGLDAEGTVGLDVKLPDCTDFSDFKKCIDEIDFIFYKCPLFKHDTEKLDFNALDVGSMWLTFVVIGVSVTTTSIIMNNIAAFIDKCIIIHSHKLYIQQQKTLVDSMEMEAKEKQGLLDNLDKLYKAEVTKVIKELEQTTKMELDGEDEGRVEQSIEKMSILLEKGMQIYSSINSSQEMKTLFAPLEMKYLSIVDEVKLLEKRKESE